MQCGSIHLKMLSFERKNREKQSKTIKKWIDRHYTHNLKWLPVMMARFLDLTMDFMHFLFLFPSARCPSIHNNLAHCYLYYILCACVCCSIFIVECHCLHLFSRSIIGWFYNDTFYTLVMYASLCAYMSCLDLALSTHTLPAPFTCWCFSFSLEIQLKWFTVACNNSNFKVVGMKSSCCSRTSL